MQISPSIDHWFSGCVDVQVFAPEVQFGHSYIYIAYESSEVRTFYCTNCTDLSS